MENFLILGAPLIVVAVAVIGLFIWGTTDSVLPREGAVPTSKNSR
jgi:hypothetical protein